LIHEAFIYSSDDEYVETLAPFLAEAVADGHGAIAITSPDRIALLQKALGPKRGSVTFVAADEWYRRPGATLAAWRATLDEYPAAQTVRAIGEVPFAGDPDAVARWTNYESLLNRALADRDAWVLCPYDTRRLTDEIVADARETHPVVSTATGRAPSAEHFAGHEHGASLAPGTARAAVQLGEARAVREPNELRRAVTWAARSAGLTEDVVADLVLAISEVARLSSGPTVRTGKAGGEWFCELTAGGRAFGELPLDEDNFGILVGRLICDSVEIDESKDRQLVRFVFGTPRPNPRRRILDASAELFHRDGVRGTGVDAIIARARVAKGTFYANFASKDDLVLAWRESPRARWLDGVRAEVEARAATPAERLTLIFDVLGEWLAEDEFRGVQMESSLAEIQEEIETYFHSAATDAELVDADRIAAQLALLFMGTITSAAARRTAEPAADARLLAAGLVESARGRRPDTA
jgi:AcrR family transcriptional regulator